MGFGILGAFALHAIKFRRKKMHPFPWPIGTCHYTDLPTVIQGDFDRWIDVDGYVDQSLIVHKTATEGPYIDFCGYKVRVIIDNVTPTTFTVKLA
jgi:hypothetical protein